MRQQSIILLVVGLAVSAYGLDLSHAAQRSTEVEPRLFDFVKDFYGQVMYRPLNHIVTNVALLSAQLLAGIAENGLPTPGGRTLHPSEAELRGFWEGLWNNGMRPSIEEALSGASLLAAQLFAGISMNGVNLGIGKRDLTEAEMRGFGDALNQAMNNVFANIIQKPMEDALSNGALMLAQVLAGMGTNGVNLSGLLGKRDLTEAEMRGFGDALSQAMNNVFANVIQKPMEDALSNGALMLAQVLAGMGTNGVNLSGLLGKRDLSDFAGREAELRGIFNSVGTNMLNGLQGVWNNVLQVPLENFIQNGALSAAALFANLGNNGVSLGKREAEARGPILGNLVAPVKPILTDALTTVIGHLNTFLAGVSQSIGRR